MKRLTVVLILAVAAATLVLPAGPRPGAAAGANSITTPDAEGSYGYTSLVLDASGNPVVSYFRSLSGTGHLKVLHCNDANCAGDDESITIPDAVGEVGYYNSLTLDDAGNPVVSYRGNNGLKVMHCNDPNCAGDDESITVPNGGGGAFWTSVELDVSGNPVVSFYISNNTLALMHCNDANCAGDDESTSAPDTAGMVGGYTSLALDASENPVVSYFDWTNRDLKVLHCNDPNCAGDDESITIPDAVGEVGYFTSLALDGAGNPIVAYYGGPNGDLKVMHCNDANCAGDDESITAPDTAGTGAEQFISLALDASGNPVVTYWDSTQHLKVMHCNDPNCAGDDESVVAPDPSASGSFASLAIDGVGNPVVSYKGSLKILHCGDRNCLGESASPVGGIAELPDVAQGDSSARNFIALAMGVAAALAALTVGAWYTRRRWLGHRP